jgi:hypothetical protein
VADGQPAVDSWLYADALDAWLRILSRLCVFTFDELDSTQVSIGLGESHAGDDTWFEYLLEGDETIVVRMAHARAEDKVMVRVWCSASLDSGAVLATMIAREYRLGLR